MLGEFEVFVHKVSWMFHDCFKGVSNKFQEGFKEVSKMFHGTYKEECFRSVPRKFQILLRLLTGFCFSWIVLKMLQGFQSKF